MASHKTSDLAARADVLVCQGAVLLLRARRKAGVVGEDLAPDVDRLLTAASLEFEQAIPATMRHAVVQLAEHIVQRCAHSRSAWRRRRGCAGRAPPTARGWRRPDRSVGG